MNKLPELTTPDVTNAASPAPAGAQAASKRLRTSLRAGGNNPLYASASLVGNNPLYAAAGNAGTNPLYKV